MSTSISIEFPTAQAAQEFSIYYFGAEIHYARTVCVPLRGETQEEIVTLANIYYKGKVVSRRSRPLPLTCTEAADRFRDFARETSYRADAAAHNARAEILKAFGDAPVPQSILDAWDFGKGSTYPSP